MSIRINNSALFRLQEWYFSQCDADWEHSHGLKIDTLDNPGWTLTVDLVDTDLADLSMQRQVIQRSEQDWVQQEVKNGQYLACGGPFNLEEMIEAFLAVATQERKVC